jgi:ABC-type branched-subunit amino acid transport system permease subunit
MAMLFIGGHTTMWGSLFAAPLLWGVTFIFPEAIASWRIVFYGILLITVLVIKPEGLITRQLIFTIRSKMSKIGSSEKMNV